jgi:hypothetical protein
MSTDKYNQMEQTVNECNDMKSFLELRLINDVWYDYIMHQCDHVWIQYINSAPLKIKKDESTNWREMEYFKPPEHQYISKELKDNIELRIHLSTMLDVAEVLYGKFHYQFGEIVLYNACITGNLDFIKLYFNNNDEQFVKIYDYDRNMRYGLVCCVINCKLDVNGKLKVIEYLMQTGYASLNISCFDCTSHHCGHNYADELHWLHYAAQQDVKLTQFFLSREERPLKITSLLGVPPIFFAKTPEIADLLLSYGSQIEITDQSGFNEEHREFIKKLAYDKENMKEQNALYFVKSGEMAKYFINLGVDVNATCNAGCTLLGVSTSEKRPLIFSAITPVSLYKDRYHCDVAKELLSQPDVYIGVQSTTYGTLSVADYIDQGIKLCEMRESQYPQYSTSKEHLKELKQVVLNRIALTS